LTAPEEFQTLDPEKRKFGMLHQSKPKKEEKNISITPSWSNA
jgi:hypothetical protein